MPHDSRLSAGLRAIHLALLVLCLVAWISGLFAGDYRKPLHWGYDIHKWVGLGFAAAMLARLLHGLIGPAGERFAAWLTVTPARLRLVREDLALLLRGGVPSREAHVGLAGAVQSAGLAAFLAIAVTGALLFLLIEPGVRATGLARGLKKVHEAAEVIIPAYLALHVGGVVAHALRGHGLWRPMFFLRERSGSRDGS